MPGTDPLISIIVPTFNRAGIILKTLVSVQQQHYKNWECIIVDDFSTDDTQAVIEKLIATDSRFRYVKNERRKGAPGARNTGLFRSNGEYISFLDSDDLLLPHCLETRYLCFKNDDKTDIVVGLQRSLQDNVETFYVNISSAIDPLIRYYSLFPSSDIPWINNVLIKKKFIISNKISWDETFTVYQDVQFNLAMVSRNPTIQWSASKFDSYWVHDSAVRSIGKTAHDILKVTQKLLDIYWYHLGHSIPLEKKKSVSKQYHAMLLDFTIRMIKKNEIDWKSFSEYLKNTSRFSPSVLTLLKFFQQLCKVKNKSYPQRFLMRRIEQYLVKKFSPVITSGTFLKVKDLEIFVVN